MELSTVSATKEVDRIAEVTRLFHKVNAFSPLLLTADTDEIPTALGLTPEEATQYLSLKRLVRLKKIGVQNSLSNRGATDPGPSSRPASLGVPAPPPFNRDRAFDAYISRTTTILNPGQAHPKGRSPIARNEGNQNQSVWARAETAVLDRLESLVTLLDNINLLQRFVKRLKDNKWLAMINTHTAKIWVFTLVFMIRKGIADVARIGKTLTQLRQELAVFLQARIAQNRQTIDPHDEAYIQLFYTKIEALQHERSMLALELSGNAIDFAFVLTEVMDFPLPRYVEGFLSVVSGLMSWYRISKVNSKIQG